MAMAMRQRTDPTRPDPLAELQGVHSQLMRFLDRFGELTSQPGDGFLPLADVEETDDAYIIELEVPGVAREDIDVSMTGRRLTVSGERKEKERVGVLRRRTRSVGRFHYDILLPGPVNEHHVSASLNDGVLTVRVPKAEGETPRRIEVE